jgi:alpha-N-arabinofuranosidase
MTIKLTRCKFAILGLVLFCSNCLAQGCSTSMEQQSAGATSVAASDIGFRKLFPQFFGFNLETIEFENSLWNIADRRVDPNVIRYLQRFPGAVYRYPGGSVVNQFDWKSAVGPESTRNPQKVVPWLGARIVRFGPAEYLDFVKQVGGTPWYTLNLYGSIESSLPAQYLADSAAGLAKFMSNRVASGLPGIYRWELGNELDRGSIKWSPEVYTAMAKKVASAVSSSYIGAEFVGMIQDWAHVSFSRQSLNYNTAVAQGLSSTTREFAAHLYYDGAPWGPPLPRVLRQLCENIASVKKIVPNPSIWVTEHARTPVGTPDDPAWKSNWPQTASLAAGISTADMMISLAKRNDVRGAFIHALHGTNGPWPFFHKGKDGVIYPSAVYWSMVLLRESMLEDVLTSRFITTNSARSDVGYDTNAVVMANGARSHFATWAVNRTPNNIDLAITIPRLANRKILVGISTISGESLEDSNYSKAYSIFPRRHNIEVDADANGTFLFSQAPYSVNALKIEIASSP